MAPRCRNMWELTCIVNGVSQNAYFEYILTYICVFCSLWDRVFFVPFANLTARGKGIYVYSHVYSLLIVMV